MCTPGATQKQKEAKEKKKKKKHKLSYKANEFQGNPRIPRKPRNKMP